MIRWKSELDKSTLNGNFQRRGWQRTGSTEDADIIWAAAHAGDAAALGTVFGPEGLVQLRPGQLINHFPNHYELTRKVAGLQAGRHAIMRVARRARRRIIIRCRRQRPPNPNAPRRRTLPMVMPRCDACAAGPACKEPQALHAAPQGRRGGLADRSYHHTRLAARQRHTRRGSGSRSRSSRSRAARVPAGDLCAAAGLCAISGGVQAAP
jgi:hypothetical protein